MTDQATEGTDGPAGPPAAWLVDAHVHLHDCFSLANSFSAAAGHFREAIRQGGLSDISVGCLLLAENQGEALFRRLQHHPQPPVGGGWSLRPTNEGMSLLACHDGQPRFALVAGHQVRTAERLEVLSLGISEPLPDGLSLESSIERTDLERGLAIIPWGFGKWWFGRGARLDRLVRDPDAPPFFLGDNGGRPQHLPESPLLRRAARRGIWNLPGSDPLPLPGEVARPGGYGFVVSAAPDLERPFAQIRDAVIGFRAQPPLFGRCAGLLHFVRAQAALRRR